MYVDDLRKWFGCDDDLCFEDMVDKIISDTKATCTEEAISAVGTFHTKLGEYGAKKIRKAINRAAVEFRQP